MNARSRLSLVFAGGCLGGLVNSLAVWLLGWTGITGALGVQIAPQLSRAWLYPRIVWGGLWGLLFLLPIRLDRFWRGLLLSLGPTLGQLLVVFPFQAHRGWLGLQLGALTPLFVVLFNAVWGWTTALWVPAWTDGDA
ncbi:MAG: hypothetical protein KatS3mg115_0360 [Candidatus Poribacteria bacterium]|nr:MAG: hypothetical protein KatS3mg115_0360 [Candidatus Poribacteria bacterium]